MVCLPTAECTVGLRERLLTLSSTCHIILSPQEFALGLTGNNNATRGSRTFITDANFLFQPLGQLIPMASVATWKVPSLRGNAVLLPCAPQASTDTAWPWDPGL